MAKIFTTGTINQPDAGSVGLAMAEKIRDDVVAHAAWTLEEEFTAASGAVRWYVFRCLASVSGLPADFFVVMGRTLSTGELRVGIAESYTIAGHMMQFHAPQLTSSNRLHDAFGRRSDTYSLATTVFPSSDPGPAYVQWIPSGTSTKWWLIVDDDAFTVAFNGASNGYMDVGAYIPLSEIANPMPICIFGQAGTNAYTRNPSIPGASVSAYALGVGSDNPTLGFLGDLRYNDRLQNNQRPVAERGLTTGKNNVATGAEVDFGWIMGKHKRRRVGLQSAPGFAFGDAYAMNGTLWVPYLPTDGNVWDTGVASS